MLEDTRAVVASSESMGPAVTVPTNVRASPPGTAPASQRIVSTSNDRRGERDSSFSSRNAVESLAGTTGTQRLTVNVSGAPTTTVVRLGAMCTPDGSVQ